MPRPGRPSGAPMHEEEGMRRVGIHALLSLVAAIAIAPAARTGATGAAERAPAPEVAHGFVLVAHGGAGDYSRMPAGLLESRRACMIEAIRKGYGILAGGGSSLDAVEAAIRHLEDSGLFDAGRGSYYTREGVPEMDAAIMDGRTLGAGSVAALRRIANPIHLARLVMDKSPHVLLVGGGAEEFARSQGVELVSPYTFYSERLWESYQTALRAGEKRAAGEPPRSGERGTVGVVALDRSGNLAAGTSTGGTVLKMPGRVGDSPLIGAGTYANNESCAVSGTGVGEFFIRNVVAADICHRVLYLHVALEEAARQVVMKELVDQHGDGGVIALDREGHVVTEFNTPGMMTGTVRSDGKILMKGWSREAAPVTVPAAP